MFNVLYIVQFTSTSITVHLRLKWMDKFACIILMKKVIDLYALLVLTYVVGLRGYYHWLT